MHTKHNPEQPEQPVLCDLYSVGEARHIEFTWLDFETVYRLDGMLFDLKGRGRSDIP